MNYEGIKHLKNNPTMEGQVKLVQNIIYSTATGENLPLTMLLPWNLDDANIQKEKKPLIVFIQGSAWTTPDREFEIPQLSAFARAGYIVATVEHRSSLNGHAFPAYLQDVKCAIRFLRANADKYVIDSQRVAIWGTSSGGNTALLVGLTGDEERFKTEEYKEYSDAVKLVVECFGPTEMISLMQKPEREPDEEPLISDIDYIMQGLCGGNLDNLPETMMKMSPMNYVEKGKDVPPFLLIHGDNDPIVPFSQMTMLYEKMMECEYDVEAWQIEGAEHEGTFWSQSVYDVIAEFIEKNIR